MAKNEKLTNAGKEQLAAIIKSLPYGDLISISEVMCNMKRARLETREDFAELLHTWAEAQ